MMEGIRDAETVLCFVKSGCRYGISSLKFYECKGNNVIVEGEMLEEIMHNGYADKCYLGTKTRAKVV